MPLTVHVEGGTSAGRRPPFRGAPEPWFCGCAVPECCRLYRPDGECCGEPDPAPMEQPGYLSACPDCGARRP